MGKGNTLQGLHVVSILTVIFFILTLCGTVSAGQLYVNETGWWHAGGTELNVSSNCSYTNWSTTYHNETKLDNQLISKSVATHQINILKSNLTDAQKKFSANLLRLINDKYLNEGQNKETLKMQMTKLRQYRSASSISLASGNQITDDLVYVYIYLKPSAETQTVDSYVWEITDRDEDNHIVVAWVSVNNLEKLASLETVRTIREVLPPHVKIGSVTTEGDAIHRTAYVRENYSQNGSGVNIGVISDGVDNFASAISSGDLPADLVVLSNTEGGDEGTAMLEIIHDMVPDAKLYFHDAGSNIVAFNSAVDALVNAGCTVIVDDVGWRGEPFFEDGTVASHISALLSSNDIIYVSAAGNAAQEHYQGIYTDDGFGFHNQYIELNIPPNGNAMIVLEWDDKFGSSENDYDLYLLDTDGENILDSSYYTQDGNDDPLEFINYANNGDSTITAKIVIYDYISTEAKTLELYIYGASISSNNIVTTDSIFGHSAVPDVIAVGAVNASDPGNDDIELFSSQGPVTIAFPSSVTRSKPELIGIDGVTVTGAGGFSNPFYGTSAAAPHVAAIAAQLWGAAPTKTAGEIRDILYSSAIDLGDPGYDYVYGYGRADMLNAYGEIAHPPLASGGFPVNNSYTNNNITSVFVNITNGGGGINLTSITMAINNSLVSFNAYPIANGYRIEKLTSQPYADGTVTVSVNATNNFTSQLKYNWSFTIDTTLPIIENFNVLSNTSVSTNNPAIASAYVSDTHLEGVLFGIVDSSNRLDTNMTVLGLYINVSGVNGTYATPPWYADAWNITNGIVENIVTTLYHADLPGQTLVFSLFKQNGSADEVEAIFWFNTTGELISITMADDAATPVTIEDGVSTFKVSTMKLMDGLDGASTYINGTTFMLYSIGNTSNPDLISKPVPSGTYTALVNAMDAAGNENETVVDVEVDNTLPVITSVNADPSEIEANGTDNTLLNVTAIDLHGIASVSVNLSAIGGLSAQPMINNSGVWQFITNTTTVGTFELPVNVTDNAVNSNTSVNISLNAVDTTCPVVIDTSSENLATDVKIDSSITTTFSEPMNSSTLNDTTVKMYKLATDKVTGETFENVNGACNSSNFEGFSHAEELKIEQAPIDDIHRTIVKGNLTYSTRPMPKYYQVYIGEGIEVMGSRNYSVISWLGDEYIAVNGQPDKLTNLVFEQKTADTKTLPIEETWDLGDGYSLKLLQIDVNNPKAWIELYNSSGLIDVFIIENQSSYCLKTTIANELKVPFFVTYLNKVTSTAIDLKYTWLISQDATVIESDDSLGVFEVTSISSDAIRLANKENVSLTRGSTIPLVNDLMFEVEDNSTLRYCLVGTSEIKTALEGDISYDSASRIVTFDPISNLMYSTTYISCIISGVEDLVGNGLIKDYEWEFNTISYTPPYTPPSSGGGGGGGGGGATGEPFENIAVKDVAREYVVIGSPVTYTFKEEINAIGFITYDAKSNPGEVAVMIEVLKGTSAMVSTSPSGEVYQNMNIWVGMSGYATEKNIGNPIVGFRVAKSWITENNIDESTIKLNRYNEGKWNALKTTKTDEDSIFMYFESQTPGFSPFAITGQKKTLVASQEPRALMSPPEPTLAVTTPTDVETPPEHMPWGSYLLFGVVALVAITGAYMYMRKRQG